MSKHSYKCFLTCDGCGEKLLELLLCSGCQVVQYCEKKCQQEDWKKHKPFCVKRRARIQNRKDARILMRKLWFPESEAKKSLKTLSHKWFRANKTVPSVEWIGKVPNDKTTLQQEFDYLMKCAKQIPEIYENQYITVNLSTGGKLNLHRVRAPADNNKQSLTFLVKRASEAQLVQETFQCMMV